MSWEKLGVAGAHPGLGTGKLSGAREGTRGLGEPPGPLGPEIQSKRVSGEVLAGEGQGREERKGGEERRGETRDWSGEGVEAEERAETGALGNEVLGRKMRRSECLARGFQGPMLSVA